MGFVLKKLISAILMPLSLVLILFVLSTVYFYKQSYKKAKIFLASALFLLLLFSSQPFSNMLLLPIERHYDALLQTPQVKYVLVLGNGHSSDDTLSITSQLNPTAINRLVEGIRHYNNLSSAKLILSGYAGADKTPHALMQERLAVSLGVKKENIITMPTPQDTLDEAVEVKKIVKNAPFILVTSASHMPRSAALFKKQGLTPYLAPTNHLASWSSDVSSYINGSNLKKSEVAMHEYLGLLYAYVRGML